MRGAGDETEGDFRTLPTLQVHDSTMRSLHRFSGLSEEKLPLSRGGCFPRGSTAAGSAGAGRPELSSSAPGLLQTTISS